MRTFHEQDVGGVRYYIREASAQVIASQGNVDKTPNEFDLPICVMATLERYLPNDQLSVEGFVKLGRLITEAEVLDGRRIHVEEIGIAEVDSFDTLETYFQSVVKMASGPDCPSALVFVPHILFGENKELFTTPFYISASSNGV